MVAQSAPAMAASRTWAALRIEANARQALAVIDDPELGTLRMPTVQPRLSETPGRIRHAGLPMGTHNDEIYQGLLGLTEEELGALKADGII